MEILEEQLDNVLEGLKKEAPSDHGFLLERTRKRSLAPADIIQSNSTYQNLPLKKNNSGIRVGRANEDRKYFSSIDVKERIISMKGKDTIEETIVIDDRDEYDIPMTQECRGVSVEINNTNGVLDDDELLAKNNNDPKRKTRKLKLSSVEIDILEKNEMLSDESIDLAQQMLAGQFPQLTGFSDIALTEKNGFDIIPREIPFIQLLHTGSMHCVI